MKIFLQMLALAFVSVLSMAPVAAQNTTPPDSNDLVSIVRRDANGVGETGAVTATTVFDGVGIGYNSGAAVTQATSRTTDVTINSRTGAITLVSAAGSATAASFTVTNSTVRATDVIVVNQASGTDLYDIRVTAVAAGSFRITFLTSGGTTTEQPVFNFAVIRGASS